MVSLSNHERADASRYHQSIMRWAGLACATVVATIALHARQAQPPQPPQQPTFRVEANLVRVDVTVIDRHGEPVTTLTAGDFAVEEDGVPQTVQSFKFVSADGRPPAGDDVSLAIRSPEHAAAEAARDEVRVFLIFWDEYHIGQFASAIQGRKALADFVSSAFGPTDLVALMDPLLPVSALRFTRDRGELAEKIKKLAGRFGVYTPTRSAVEDAQLGRRDVARVRSEVTLSAMKSAAVHLGSLKEGRKAILFVSEGLTGLGIDEPMLVQELTDEANNNNTAIYTLDPRGLIGGSADVLRTISESTGAQAFVNTNAPAKALRQVVKESSAFYLLGYGSAKNPSDGRFHKINVRVKRPGVDVRARNGYWAPSQTDRERAAADAAAAVVAPDVSSALAVLSTRADRTLDVWMGAALGANRRPEVTVAWSPRPQSGRRRNETGTVTVTIRAAGGNRAIEAPVEAGRLAFEASPGELHLQTVMRDASGQTLDEDDRTLTLPDFRATTLALSSPVVVRVRNPSEMKAMAASADVAPFAGHEFARTDRLFVRFVVYGTAAPQAVVSAHLLSRAGAPLQRLPIAPLAGVDASYQIDLPLASTARGEFLVAIEVSHGDERARALVPLRLVS